MKILPIALVFASLIAAQSQSTPCGAAADGVSTGGAASGARSGAETAGQSATQVSAPGNAAAQIQRRPTPVPGGLTCRCGIVSANSLTSVAKSQEIAILPGLSGSFRFDHVLVREARRFASDSVATLSVGLGRAGFGADMISAIPLKSASAPFSFWYDRLTPPQITGTYDLMLYFQAPTLLGNGESSNFKDGTVAWEVCGYNARPAGLK